METDANRGRTRGRGEVDDDQDSVPEHLKCAVCLGEGGGRVSSRARGPKEIRVPCFVGSEIFRVKTLLPACEVLLGHTLVGILRAHLTMT